MIHIKDLHFSYKRKQVFEHLDLDFKAGHIHGVLGGNGTGKTTLLRLIAGLVFPQSGELRFEGWKPGNRHPGFLSQVMLVGEDIYMPPLAAAELPRMLGRFYPNFADEAFAGYLESFQIPEHGRPDEMSFGQRKKLMLAFAMAANTPLLLMDEPTNGLDIPSKTTFRKLMAGIGTEDKCVLISSHQVQDIEHLVDHLTILGQLNCLLHQSMTAISSQLSFGFSPHPPSENGLIYKENSLAGYSSISVNTGETDSRVDLETLYKAVCLKGEKIQSIFHTQTHNHEATV